MRSGIDGRGGNDDGDHDDEDECCRWTSSQCQQYDGGCGALLVPTSAPYGKSRGASCEPFGSSSSRCIWSTVVVRDAAPAMAAVGAQMATVVAIASTAAVTTVAAVIVARRRAHQHQAQLHGTYAMGVRKHAVRRTYVGRRLPAAARRSAPSGDTSSRCAPPGAAVRHSVGAAAAADHRPGSVVAVASPAHGSGTAVRRCRGRMVSAAVEQAEGPRRPATIITTDYANMQNRTAGTEGNNNNSNGR